MRVLKYLSVFSLLVVLSVSVVACGDDDNNKNNGNNTLTGPAGVMSLMTAWGTTGTDNPNKRDNMTGANFKHDDHDDEGLTCTSCHATNAGGRIDVDNLEGADKWNKIHTFCATKCHTTQNDAPQSTECYECHKVTSRVDLKTSWGLTGDKEPVTFKHGDHDDDKLLCTNCHISPNDGELNIAKPTDKTTAHKFCNDCHTTDNDAPNTAGKCDECHKPSNLAGMPVYEIDLKKKWNTGSTTISVPAIFEHKDHRELANCTQCHATKPTNNTEGKININLTAGTTIQDKAHKFCGTCHKANLKAPQVDNRNDCEDCHDD